METQPTPPLPLLTVQLPPKVKRPSATPSEEGAKRTQTPCPTHSDAKRGSDGWPYRHKVSQHKAREWWYRGTQIGADGQQADVRAIRLRGRGDLRLRVVVKQFSEQFGGRSPEENAKAEVETHLLAWSYMTEECRSHLAVPACMDWQQTQDQGPNEWYTVQGSVEEEGLKLDGAYDFLVQKARGRLRELPVAERRKVASSFGQMLACIHKAGLKHADLHGDNVLVLHNLPYDRLEPIDTETFAVKWRVVDWGGEPVVKAVWNSDARERRTGKLCGWENGTPSWLASPGFAWKTAGDDGGVVENCTQEKSHVLHLLVLALADYNMDKYKPIYGEQYELRLRDPQLSGLREYAGPVTSTVVAHWVRQAYAKGLGIEIPDDLQEIVKKRLRDEESMGGTGEMPEV